MTLILGGTGTALSQIIDSDDQQALIDELEQTNELVREAHETGQADSSVTNPESYAALQLEVARLNDPATIPFLARALGYSTLIPFLTDYGEQAAPAVLDVVTDPRSPPHAVYDGLIVLRMMLETEKDRPLSIETKESIRAAALDQILQGIATDSTVIDEWGLGASGLGRRIQQAATDGLAGVPPRPRYEDFTRE